MDNRNLYRTEREKRWNMAKEKEPQAIKFICDELQRMSGHIFEKTRYDEIWFRRYSVNNEKWVRGASDYLIRIDRNKYVYAEIKLKSVLFRKTLTGGKTKKGSEIANYGCESFYLDVVPVYKNMCAFVEKANIDSRNFLIFFVDEEVSRVYVISLDEIQQLIKNGYKGQKLCVFSEGYGTKTEYGAAPNYLIPKLATTELNAQYILEHSCNTYVTKLPQ